MKSMWQLYPKLDTIPPNVPVWMRPGVEVVNQHGQVGDILEFRDMGPPGPGVLVLWRKAQKRVLAPIANNRMKPVPKPVATITAHTPIPNDYEDLLTAVRAQGRQLVRIVESLDKLQATMNDFVGILRGKLA